MEVLTQRELAQVLEDEAASAAKVHEAEAAEHELANQECYNVLDDEAATWEMVDPVPVPEE